MLTGNNWAQNYCLKTDYKRTTLSYTPDVLVVVHQSDPVLIK